MLASLILLFATDHAPPVEIFDLSATTFASHKEVAAPALLDGDAPAPPPEAPPTAPCAESSPMSPTCTAQGVVAYVQASPRHRGLWGFGPRRQPAYYAVPVGSGRVFLPQRTKAARMSAGRIFGGSV